MRQLCQCNNRTILVKWKNESEVRKNCWEEVLLGPSRTLDQRNSSLKPFSPLLLFLLLFFLTACLLASLALLPGPFLVASSRAQEFFCSADLTIRQVTRTQSLQHRKSLGKKGQKCRQMAEERFVPKQLKAPHPQD